MTKSFIDTILAYEGVLFKVCDVWERGGICLISFPMVYDQNICRSGGWGGGVTVRNARSGVVRGQ